MIDRAGKIIVVQQQLPRYRRDLFVRLSQHYKDKFQVYYGAGNLGSLSDDLDVPGWGVFTGMARKLPGGFEWQRKVVRLKLTNNDVLVLWGNPKHLSTLLLLLRARFHGAKVVWWGHYWSSTSRRWRQVLRFLPMLLSDALLFYTDNEIEKYISDRLTPNKAPKLAALNNGLNIDPILSLRESYKVAERDTSLLFIGRLSDKAELELALKALYVIGASAPKLHVIGDGKNIECLKHISEKMRLGDRVIWHGSIVNEIGIAKIANSCRAFLYPGEVGLSLIHAMAYGIPVIVHGNQMRHMPEIAAFREEENGRSFKWRDAESLAKVINSLFADRSALERMSSKALETVEEKYNTVHMTDRFKQLIHELDALQPKNS